MPKAKKKFIDKKNSVTFRLVHRSQQDPLIADENAPQHVLQPLDDTSKKEVEKRLEEQRKFGIYYDDDYNYMQHLRDANPSMEWEEVVRIPASTTKPPTQNNKKEEPIIKLPSSVFASEVEEDVGLLNKAATQSGLRLDLDPDIVAALDDDFDFDDPNNELEDDFIAIANASGSDIDEEEDGSEQDYSSDGEFQLSDEDEDQEGDDMNNRKIRFTGIAKSAKSVGKKSVFSEYSHTSYNPDRPELLKHLDDRFEYFMENNYTDEQIGGLEHEEVEGHIDPNSDYILKLADEFAKEQQSQDLPQQDPELKERILKRAEDIETKPEQFEYIKIKQKLPFDVESFHSTSSNLYNRPKLITITNENNKNRKTKNNKLDVCNEDEEEEDDSSSDANSVQESMISQISRLSMRPKNETPEERRERKKEFRNLKKEKRILKKTIKESFKDKELQEAQVEINKANVKGKRLM